MFCFLLLSLKDGVLLECDNAVEINSGDNRLFHSESYSVDYCYGGKWQNSFGNYFKIRFLVGVKCTCLILQINFCSGAYYIHSIEAKECRLLHWSCQKENMTLLFWRRSV